MQVEYYLTLSMKSCRVAVTWMERYFSKQCDIMPTTRRLHLSDNFTRHEVYQAYKDDMLLDTVP